MKNTALVTGADKGIGLQVARQLAECGYTVILGARDLITGQHAAASVAGDAAEIIPLRLDLTKPATFDDAFDFIQSRFRQLDVLVNNAGIALDWDYQADNVPIELIRQTFEARTWMPSSHSPTTQAKLPSTRLLCTLLMRFVIRLSK
jgi:NAD(P)-dependent dehydrogenase (short-subunit alcohol dehydrogenase family)